MKALALLVLPLLAIACQLPPPADGLAVEDLDGARHTPLELGDARAQVLFFVTTDCPIANSYAPEIAAIVADHAGEPLRFAVVHVDPDITPAVARRHATDYRLPGPIVLDPEHRLAQRLGIAITPEVAVVLPGTEIAYRGRIDNAWGDLGARKPEPSQRDLRDALAAVLQGRPVPQPRTEAIGCDLPVL